MPDHGSQLGRKLNMRFSKLFRAMAPAAFAFFAGVPAVLLSTAASAAEPAQTSAVAIEEILVTSTRSSESIQDVP